MPISLRIDIGHATCAVRDANAYSIDREADLLREGASGGRVSKRGTAPGAIATKAVHFEMVSVTELFNPMAWIGIF
ncbi:hypothetical protein ABD05_31275 [Burkholderia pyrrocinia]|nr:hypothetical protein ABD05_31275 [Burkholderia pyrrocinia]